MGFWLFICLSPPNLYPLGDLLCPLAFLPLSAGLGLASLSQLWPLCFRPALPCLTGGLCSWKTSKGQGAQL